MVPWSLVGAHLVCLLRLQLVGMHCRRLDRWLRVLRTTIVEPRAERKPRMRRRGQEGWGEAVEVGDETRDAHRSWGGWKGQR